MDYISNPSSVTPELALDLLALSSKFLVDSLKFYVEDLLITEFEIEIEDAAALYEFAVIHNSLKLQQAVLSAIRKSKMSVYQTEGFSQIAQDVREKLKAHIK